ncbi:MAG: type II toxin-antitoxin system ParD family antitoxin [Planctomycetaceae bacterium]|nr:type II toxin-antitoxin system ParD family antitoxin [Planctomycetaceae bacterium]
MPYSFPTELQQLVQRQLATGNYANEDEVLLDAMIALNEREELLQQWKAEIRSRIDSLDRGEGIELQGDDALQAFADEIKSEGRRAYEANRSIP